MTSKLKCPFCKEEIISDLCLMCDKIDKDYTSGRRIYKCNKCSLFGNKELWRALIQAKQDLEVATQALEKLKYEYNRCRDEEFEGVDIDWEWWAMAAKNVVETALKQIEHKDENNE